MYLGPSITFFPLVVSFFFFFNVFSGHYYLGWNLICFFLPNYLFPFNEGKAWSLQDLTLAYELHVWKIWYALKDGSSFLKLPVVIL